MRLRPHALPHIFFRCGTWTYFTAFGSPHNIAAYLFCEKMNKR